MRSNQTLLIRGSIAAANKSQIPLTPRAAPRMEVGSTSLRAARTSTPRKMSWARIAGRFRPIWSARELVSQFPRYGRRALSPGESRGSRRSTTRPVAEILSANIPVDKIQWLVIPSATSSTAGFRTGEGGMYNLPSISTPGSLANRMCCRWPCWPLDSSRTFTAGEEPSVGTCSLCNSS